MNHLVLHVKLVGLDSLEYKVSSSAIVADGVVVVVLTAAALRLSDDESCRNKSLNSH